MTPRIIEDEVEQREAMHRLEVVVQERIKPLKPLTERQWEILYTYIVLEYTEHDDVGSWLGISPLTAKKHLSNIGLNLTGTSQYHDIMNRIRNQYWIQVGRDESRGLVTTQ